MTKTGKYTEEEFDIAHNAFKQNRKPLIYPYFKDDENARGNAKREEIKFLWKFQDKLKN